MPSNNPAMNEQLFQREIQRSRGGFSPGWAAPDPGAGTPAGPVDPGAFETMRVGGTVSATGILLAIVIVAGWFGWQAVTVISQGFRPDGTEITTFTAPPWLMISCILGLVLAIVTIVKPKLARVTGPLYAMAQGLLIGAISHAYEAQFQGIVLQAVGLTMGVFIIMLVLFATGSIRVTDKLRTGVIAATGAVFLVYLASFVLRLFGSTIPMIHEAGPLGIGFSLLVVGIAAFNLLLDFDFIQRGAAMGAPRYMEWFGAFALMVTLIWLYLEVLRLLGKLRSR